MMPDGLDFEKLRSRLEARLGFGITRGVETVEGGQFPVYRLAGIERGIGFGIVIARTPRQIEASFLADNFAATLLRRMSDADESARATFSSVLAEAEKSNTNVYVSVNGNPVDMLPDNSDDWRKVELDVSVRLLSGKQPDDDVLNRAVAVCSYCFSLVLALLAGDDIVEPPTLLEKGLPEGARLRVEVNRYERSPANRAACIARYGTTCQACGFDFQSKYGERGEGYIEVHHTTPVSQMGESYSINPIVDLVPLCANCHAMIHRSDPIMTVPQLKGLLQEVKTQKSPKN